VAGEQFAKFVKVADIPMDREKLAMYFNTITYNNNQINRTYTNNFAYFRQSFNDLYEHDATYYISTDSTIIANGKQDRQYRLDNQYFRPANSIVEDYNEFGFFDNPAVAIIPEFESYFHIQEVNKVFDMYLTNEVNYIRQDVIEFWKSSRPNFVNEFPIVTIDYQPYIYLKNGEVVQEDQAVGYYQDYFVTYNSSYDAKFIRLSDMQTFYLNVYNNMYDLFGIDIYLFYLFIYDDELYCVVIYGLEDDSNFPNVYSKVYKVTITGIEQDTIIAAYTLVNSYTNQAHIIWANQGYSIPHLVHTNIYKHISFNDMLYNPIKKNNVFLNAVLQHTYIVDLIYPTLSTYQDKYIIFNRMDQITQSSNNLYIRDNIIFDKSLDPNGSPVFYYSSNTPLAYDSVTNNLIMATNSNKSYSKLNYTQIINGIYNQTYIVFISNSSKLIGAHDGWFYYIENYYSPVKLRRFNYTTLVSEDIITIPAYYSSIGYIQINSILYIWFPINSVDYRIYKIDMMSPSSNLYVDIPSNNITLFFDIPANNIFNNKLQILEFDWVNHTFSSRNILEGILDIAPIIYLNDLGLYKIIIHENTFEYDNAERIYGEQDSPYVDRSYFVNENSITNMHLTSTEYRSTYSIYKLVYANDLSLDEPKTLETTIR